MTVVDASTTPRDSQQAIGSGELGVGISNILPDTDDEGDSLGHVTSDMRTIRIKCDINIVERHISRPARIKETRTGVFSLRLTPTFDPGHVSIKDLEIFKSSLRRLACNYLKVRDEQIAIIRIGRRKCMTNLCHLRTNLSTYFRRVGRGQSIQFYKGLSLDVTISQDDVSHQEIGISPNYISHPIASSHVGIGVAQTIMPQHSAVHINPYMQLSGAAPPVPVSVTVPSTTLPTTTGPVSDDSLPIETTCTITNLITRNYPNIRPFSPSHLAEWVQHIAQYPAEQWAERVARGIPSNFTQNFYFQPLRPVDFKFRLLLMELPEEVFDEAYLYLQNLRQHSIQEILSRCPSQITDQAPISDSDRTN